MPSANVSTIALLFLDCLAVLALAIALYRRRIHSTNKLRRSAFDVAPETLVLGLLHPYWYFIFLSIVTSISKLALVMLEVVVNECCGLPFLVCNKKGQKSPVQSTVEI